MSLQRKRILPVARDGYRFILPVLLVALVFAVFQVWWLSLVFLLLTGYVIYFFRDPERKGPKIDGAILAPADGRVTAIEEVDHSGFENGRAKKISIFLSIFNVHINRSPVEGTVGSVDYHPGKFINAMADKSSDENEHNDIEIINGRCRVYVKQIAGMIARRIVCVCRTGEEVTKGQRIGLIRFGSRVDTFLPTHAEVKIKPGMTVKGGESILAVMKCPLKNGENPE